MKRPIFVYMVLFFGALHAADSSYVFNKKGVARFDEIKADARNYVKDYSTIQARNDFDKAYVKLNGNAESLTVKVLEKIFNPCMVKGDYEPMRHFFYDEIALFDREKHGSIEDFLRGNMIDPVCIYLYLRWWSKYGNKDVSDDTVKELWFKRYLAELLVEFDFSLLNIPQNNELLIGHARSIINLFRYRLDQRMHYVSSSTLSKKDILCSVKEKLVKRLKWTDIKLHGDPHWLLTTSIATGWNLRQYFVYNSYDAEHPMLLCYHPLKLTSEEQFIRLQSCTALFIQNLDAEIAQLS